MFFIPVYRCLSSRVIIFVIIFLCISLEKVKILPHFTDQLKGLLLCVKSIWTILGQPSLATNEQYIHLDESSCWKLYLIGG